MTFSQGPRSRNYVIMSHQEAFWSHRSLYLKYFVFQSKRKECFDWKIFNRVFLLIWQPRDTTRLASEILRLTQCPQVFWWLTSRILNVYKTHLKKLSRIHQPEYIILLIITWTSCGHLSFGDRTYRLYYQKKIFLFSDQEWNLYKQ